jgi:hypothetical protein
MTLIVDWLESLPFGRLNWLELDVCLYVCLSDSEVYCLLGLEADLCHPRYIISELYARSTAIALHD